VLRRHCSRCAQFEDYVDELAWRALHQHGVRLVRIDIDDSPVLFARFLQPSAHTFVFVECTSQTGRVTTAMLLQNSHSCTGGAYVGAPVSGTTGVHRLLQAVSGKQEYYRRFASRGSKSPFSRKWRIWTLVRRNLLRAELALRRMTRPRVLLSAVILVISANACLLAALFTDAKKSKLEAQTRSQQKRLLSRATRRTNAPDLTTEPQSASRLTNSAK